MRTVSIDHFKNYKQPIYLSVSQGGEISFLLRSIDIENDKYINSLHYIKSIDNDFSFKRNRNNILEGREFIQWLDTGEAILKESKNDQEYIYYRHNLKDKSLEQIFQTDLNVEKLALLSNNKYLLLASNRVKEDENFFVADEVPFLMDDIGYCNRLRSGIFLCDNGNILRLTDKSLNVYDFNCYKDKYAIFYGKEYENVRPTDSKLYYMDLSNYQIEQVKDDEVYVYTYVTTVNDDIILAVRSDRKLYGEYQDEYIDEINLKTGKIRRLNGDCFYHLFDDINTDITPGVEFIIDLIYKDDGVFFLSTVKDSCHLLYGSFKDNTIKQITRETGKVMDFKICNDKVYMIAMRGLAGSEIYQLNLETLEEKQITQINSHNLNYLASVPEEFVFTNKDGIEINGWIMKPIQFDKDKSYPAILYIHGGPNTAYGNCYFHEMQYLASEGYGIFYCNPRGSIGKGGEFADLRNKHGTIDYEDLMEFVEVIVSKNTWIDRHRLGVTGGSYGGFMTNWIIGHTTIFSAAVSDRSVSNNTYDFFISDIGFSCVEDTFGATPWSDEVLLWQKSPLKYAPNVKTPTLFIHGAQDYRCNKDQALQMFASLKYFGIPSRAVIMKGEGHGLSREGIPSRRIRRLMEIKNWFDAYL